MVELVDTVVLEATASASEFESRLGHHIKAHCRATKEMSSVLLYGKDFKGSLMSCRRFAVYEE